ncbi:hypothetical protein BP5796_00831 [Coleophoma crateriformis]|uniref:Cytochrome P450 67 n=1 Tax=Coleophoma crateriformis TaxID=565419 RepID=A0A3D8TB56_9HELO|nr:hypothetical protein BP5796_00831 [Coleophoma crateriformis]
MDEITSRIINGDAQMLCMVTFVLGVIFHLGIRTKEVDYMIWRLLGLYLGVSVALVVYLHQRCSDSILASVGKMLLADTAFNTGLTTSLALYRLFFHRLRNFPGPVFAKLSRFHATILAARNIQYNVEVRKLHEKYGDFVRTGPREISIMRASAVPAIYGPQTECRRSTWYSQVSDDVKKCSLNSSRDFEDHKRRRRAWDRGFSVKALSTYEARIGSKTDLFVSRMRELAGKSVNITQWSMFFTFDTMGAVGFGKEFRMLDDAAEHSAIKGLHEQMTVLGILGTVPWLLHLLSAIPGLAGSYEKFTQWCAEQAEQKERVFDPAKDPSDIFSWLLKAKFAGEASASPGHQALMEDSRLIIIAGSDTTATVLANCFYYLTKHPHIFKKLQTILDQIFPQGASNFTYEKVKAIPFLEGIINETLRLKPPIIGGLQRVTPPEGLQVDEVYIPGDTIVIVPTQAVQQDARYFQDPTDFAPERWMEDSELMMNKAAYAPFSLGVYGCIGKHLALMQLRSIVSQVVMNFNLKFAPGEDGAAFDTEALDTFTTTLKSLDIVFSEREGKHGLSD